MRGRDPARTRPHRRVVSKARPGVRHALPRRRTKRGAARHRLLARRPPRGPARGARQARALRGAKKRPHRELQTGAAVPAPLEHRRAASPPPRAAAGPPQARPEGAHARGAGQTARGVPRADAARNALAPDPCAAGLAPWSFTPNSGGRFPGRARVLISLVWRLACPLLPPLLSLTNVQLGTPLPFLAVPLYDTAGLTWHPLLHTNSRRQPDSGLAGGPGARADGRAMASRPPSRDLLALPMRIDAEPMTPGSAASPASNSRTCSLSRGPASRPQSREAPLPGSRPGAREERASRLRACARGSAERRLESSVRHADACARRPPARVPDCPLTAPARPQRRGRARARDQQGGLCVPRRRCKALAATTVRWAPRRRRRQQQQQARVGARQGCRPSRRRGTLKSRCACWGRARELRTRRPPS